MAWHQGDDLYGYDDNRLLAGAEYVAKYNLGEDVPYKPYTNKFGTFEHISDVGRGGLRANWEILYNHYVRRKGLAAPYTTAMAAKGPPRGRGRRLWNEQRRLRSAGLRHADLLATPPAWPSDTLKGMNEPQINADERR